MKGKKENESPRSDERLKQGQINSAVNANGYKEHPEVVLLPEDPGIDILSIGFIKLQSLYFRICYEISNNIW